MSSASPRCGSLSAPRKFQILLGVPLRELQSNCTPGSSLFHFSALDETICRDLLFRTVRSASISAGVLSDVLWLILRSKFSRARGLRENGVNWLALVWLDRTRSRSRANDNARASRAMRFI